MDLNLKGKRALISGGTYGIGLSCVNILTNEGCDVSTFSRHKDIDVLSDDFESQAQKFNDFDILINNVGGGGRWGKDFLSTDMSIWNDVYNKNMRAAIILTRTIIPYMFKKKWGRIITISSIYGKETGNGKPWFDSAKSAQISFMKSLSHDKYLVRNDITFNTICPGHIDIGGSNNDINVNDFPLGRMGSPNDIANIVAFLCSDLASFINGSCITVDGGESHSF